MIILASNAQKKTFIKWFLKHYQLKQREGVWLLNYLLTSDELLSYVHFTDDADYCPQAIFMSTVETNGLPFRFFNKAMMSADPQHAFNLLKQLKSDVYIQLNFKGRQQSAQYVAVLETNPYHQNEKPNRPIIDLRQSKTDMDYTMIKQYEEHLRERIDQALDAGDKETFMKLVQQLNNLVH